MKIAIGSKNPGKIKATKQAIANLKLNATVSSYYVPSCVHAMPLSLAELKTGSINRAIQAYHKHRENHPDKDEQTEHIIGLGLEGGIFPKKGKWYLGGVTAGFNGSQITWNQGFEIPIPTKIAEMVIDQNKELGDVIDQLVHKENTKHDEGAIYYLTNNTIKRHDVFTMEIMMVISAFKQNEFKNLPLL